MQRLLVGGKPFPGGGELNSTLTSGYTPENRTASHKEFLIAQRDRRT